MPRAEHIDPRDPAWNAVRTDDGSWTLAHPRHGETCHSRAGAWQQALERYARPCRLRERALAGARELWLLDIGTGLGLNLAAALAELDGSACRLRAITFERDASVIDAMQALVAREHTLDARAEPFHALVRAALLEHSFASHEERALGTRGTLRLVCGDVRDRLAELAPRELVFDAVFLDGFSPRQEPEFWDGAWLREVARRMASGAWLSTYTVSKPVRRALASAGLEVQDGPAVGRKRAGTLARRP